MKTIPEEYLKYGIFNAYNMQKTYQWLLNADLSQPFILKKMAAQIGADMNFSQCTPLAYLTRLEAYNMIRKEKTAKGTIIHLVPHDEWKEGAKRPPDPSGQYTRGWTSKNFVLPQDAAESLR